jgi:hypothetical protein
MRSWGLTRKRERVCREILMGGVEKDPLGISVLS